MPWFIRPLTASIANKFIAALISPNLNRHFTLLESYLETSPDAGKYLCGQHLTGADIHISYVLLASKDAFKDMGKWEKGTPETTFPKLFEYINRLENEPGWKKTVEKVRELDGDFYLSPYKPPK